LENGRISEADWWQHEADDDEGEMIARPEEEELEVESEQDNDDEEEEEQDEYNDNDQASLASTGGGGAATPSSSLSPSSETSSLSAAVNNSTSTTKKQKKFVNQGLALWLQGREAWKTTRPAVTATTPVPGGVRRRDPASIPDSFKKELVKCLGDRRHFELSQRIPLSTMIEAYQEAWKNERANE
jgi:hypothetical protein